MKINPSDVKFIVIINYVSEH